MRQMGGEGCFSNLALKDATSLSPSAPLKFACGVVLPGSLNCYVQSSMLWFPSSSKEESSQMLLSCRSGSMSSTLPRSGVLVRFPLMLLCFWIPLPLLCSGMNKATRNHIRTIHAPNKNGGPGTMASCRVALLEFNSVCNLSTSTWNR